MLFGFCLLVCIYLLYVLLVEGALWKIIVAGFGWFGMHIALIHYYPISKHICLILTNSSFTWAEVIPTIIVLLAMLYSKE